MKNPFVFSRKRLLIFITILCVIFSPFVFFKYGYRFNLSNSLPYHFFRVLPVSADDIFLTGDYIAVDITKISHPAIQIGIQRDYIKPKYYLVKKIGAVSGDVIVISGDILFINGEETPIFLDRQDSLQRPLTPFPTPVTLARDSYWLISNPNGGFDSRYFGAVDRSSIVYRAFPIF
jgi:conjugative transfer signal peptidase TraF